jgi:hypothetical protein
MASNGHHHHQHQHRPSLVATPAPNGQRNHQHHPMIVAATAGAAASPLGTGLGAAAAAMTTEGLLEQHRRFETLHEQLFACVDQLRRVPVIDSQSLGFKLAQLDDAHSVQASLRQQLEQQHAELSQARNSCIRFETENAGLLRDVQVLKSEARTRQAKHQVRGTLARQFLPGRNLNQIHARGNEGLPAFVALLFCYGSLHAVARAGGRSGRRS